MNLNILNAAQMVSLTEAWTNEQKDLFMSIPVLAPLFPEVAAAHALVEGVNTRQNISDLDQALSDELKDLDRSHDTVLRIIQALLESSAHWCEIKAAADAERARAIRKLSARILPEGMSWAQRPYREEVGHALRVMKRLTVDEKRLLTTVSIEGTSGLELVEYWENVGRGMAVVLRKRDNLSEAGDIDLREARRAWQRAVSMVLYLIENSASAQDKARMLIQPIAKAVEAQTARLSQRGKAEAAVVEAKMDTAPTSPHDDQDLYVAPVSDLDTDDLSPALS